ncbi:MAG: M3 family oligoendopeptidase [Deinococcota bacterium]
MSNQFADMTLSAGVSSTSKASQVLPHWQLESIYPSLESEAWAQANRDLEGLIATFISYCDTLDKAEETDSEIVDTFNTGFQQWLEIRMLVGKMMGYLSLTLSTDAFDEPAQAEKSRLGTQLSKLSIYQKTFVRWLGGRDLEQLSQQSPLARDHRYVLAQLAIGAEHMMDDPAEALESALEPTAASAWVSLYREIISKQTVVASIDGEPREYALSELKNFASDPGKDVRKRAYEAEMELFSNHDITIAACLNSIKGHVNTLTSRRGWRAEDSDNNSALAEALFTSSISKKSLDAMQHACQAAFPMFRRYLKAKAKLLGKDTLDWYDINAPISQNLPQYTWPAAQDFIVTHFASYSGSLAAFAQKAFDKQWIDVPPRKGKVSGAFCAPVMSEQASRILLNFGGNLDDLFTLAHELGHGYHNDCMYRFERTTAQASSPMTLAETASIFCETIVVNALLAAADQQGDDQAKLAILEQDLLGATQLVVDIHSRFLFEHAVFNKRHDRELSVNELKEAMLEAQTQTYGDALTPATYHPYMWAQKGHYYSTGRSFYNFPYTFGYLFGLGLYQRYQQNPDKFKQNYDELLSRTGMADAPTLAAEFGIDIEAPAFWEASLAVATERIVQFEALVEAR